jgi:putative peptidoglycan lipid II flippase
MNDAPAAGGLFRNSIIVGAMTMVSRVFGLVRDMVIANYFGAGASADVFFLAFKIPNFFRRLFAEGAFAQAFVPVLAEYRTQRTEPEVRELIDAVSGTLGVQLAIVTAVGVIAAPLLIALFAAGFVYNGEAEKIALATSMLRLTFPYLMLVSLTAFAGAILNSYDRFAVPAFTPVLLNVSLIGAAVVLRPYLAEPAMALAWGVLIAGVAQLTFQLPFLARESVIPRPRINFKHEGVKRILTLMVPALFGASVSQINLLLDTALATFLPTGSLSWLYYSDRLLELPLALFGIAIGTVILPVLSREQSAGTPSEFSRTLDWGIRGVCLVGVPATAALFVLADALIATLFFQGEMTPRDVTMAGFSLKAYALGLLGHMLVRVLAPGFFARQDIKTPVRIGIVAMTTNMVLNLLLIVHLQHVGLALATSLAAFVNAGLLLVMLKRHGVFTPQAGWLKLLVQMGVGLAAMVGMLLLATPAIGLWLGMSFPERLGLMLLISAGGAVTYGAALFLVGFRLAALRR